MKKMIGKFLISFLPASTLLVAVLIFVLNGIGFKPVKADSDATAVTVGTVDYDNLTIKVYKNGNSILYFSSDGRKTWNEVEGDSDSDGNGAYILMDISWVSSKADTTVYFKGNKVTTALDMEFPKMNSSFKVTFDKVNIDFEFSGYEEATSFMWRKSTDYNWMTVPFDKSSQEYKNFLKKINDLRFKGCKVVFLCNQVPGTDAEHPGQRPSKEVTVSIPKMANAPSIKVNVKKMTLNTKVSMEYYDTAGNKWVSCSKNMTIADIAPKALYSASKEGTSVNIKIRTAATEKKPYSKTAIVTIPGQTMAPEFGAAGHVKTEFSDGVLLLTFTKASSTAPIDYCIVKNGETFDVTKAKWKTIKSAKQIKVKKKSVPDGSTIYIRFSGINKNDSKNISLKLPSYYASYSITWPAETTTTK